jgi:ATP-dependent Lon protease
MISCDVDLGTLPVVPVLATIVLPHRTVPLAIGRASSLAAVDAALATDDKHILVVAQQTLAAGVVRAEDLHRFATRAVIRKTDPEADEGLKVTVAGIERVRIESFDTRGPYLTARYSDYPLAPSTGPEIDALRQSVLELARKALEQSIPDSVDVLMLTLNAVQDARSFVYQLAAFLALEPAKEQQLLEVTTVEDALWMLHAHLSHELLVLELRQKIKRSTQTALTRQQREHVLRTQLRAIQEELGDEGESGISSLREKLEEAELPDAIRVDAEKELARLSRMSSASADHQVLRGYLELVLDLPWTRASSGEIDMTYARAVLDEDHFGLDEVKERIMEHLGVLKMNASAKAPILCFSGPPGVGKTSIGRSIARALGRKFERISLGGLHDEAELRGHRRTYVGAMPGRIIQAIRRAGTNNPVLMLDEIDKIGRDFRGDPAAALLEILDPDQNATFRDNYIDLPFDLSNVLFLGTANTLDPIPPALLDRMEVIRLAGYSEEEKLEIANRYLLPKQLRNIGLDDDQLTLPCDVLCAVIADYTREAGVRELERQIARLARKATLRIVTEEEDSVQVSILDLETMLGPPLARDSAREHLPAGVAAGLAWTASGGDVLYVESALLPGTRGATITGHLGEVMQESVKTAQSLVWSMADRLGIDQRTLLRCSVHVHVPSGAIPKDGPSAGVTIATALASLYSGCSARNDTAMTGEITLTGLVFAVGGLKEKLLAAKRNGLKRVIVPKTNDAELRALPDAVKRDLEIVTVEHIEEVWADALPRLRLRPAIPSRNTERSEVGLGSSHGSWMHSRT